MGGAFLFTVIFQTYIFRNKPTVIIDDFIFSILNINSEPICFWAAVEPIADDLNAIPLHSWDYVVTNSFLEQKLPI